MGFAALNPSYKLNDKEEGMAQMSQKFLDLGAKVYVEADVAVKEANKAL